MGGFARRIWMALILVGLLGGCQQPGGDAGLKAASQPGNDGKLRFFEPEFAALLDQVVESLEQTCGPSATDEERLNGCLRDHFAAAFDDSRQGRRSCDFHREVSEYIGCVAIGNTLIDVRHRLADDSPLPASFWREDDAMIDALSETIVKRGIDSCGISGGTQHIQECVMAWFEDRVALPASLATRCENQSEDKDRYGCFVEGVMLRYLQDHVPRLGATST
jgi:hypothetical protein